MHLKALKFLKRAEIGILVVETNHKADRHLVVFQVIKERSAISIVVDGPAGTVNHQSLFMFFRFDLPQFLDAEAICLRLDAFTQIELCHQLLAEAAAAPFGKEGVFGVQLHTDLIVRPLLALAGYAHIAGRHTFDRAIVIIEDLRSGKPRINLHTQGFRLLAQPTAKVAQTDDVITVVLHRRRQQEGRQGKPAGLAQIQELLRRHRSIERCLHVFPIREQLVQGARFQHRTR